MKQNDEPIARSEEGFELRLRPRPATDISLQIPDETLASLEKIAAGRDMSPEALMKFYIGQGLRQDLARLYADQLLDRTAQVLTRHIQSEEEVLAILQEIRVETVG